MPHGRRRIITTLVFVLIITPVTITPFLLGTYAKSKYNLDAPQKSQKIEKDFQHFFEQLQSAEHESGEMLVEFREGFYPDRAFLGQNGLSIQDQGKAVLEKFIGPDPELTESIQRNGLDNLYLLRAGDDDDRTLSAALAVCAANSSVDFAEPNFLVHTAELKSLTQTPTQSFEPRSINDQCLPNDPRVNELWGMAMVQAPQAWCISTKSSVVVASIDTGVDLDHEDLNIFTNPGETGPDASGRDKATNGIDDDGNGFKDDDHGWSFLKNNNKPNDGQDHGSNTSGIIGAIGNNKKGVAGGVWDIQILPIQFLNGFGSGSTGNAIKSIMYANLMTKYGVKISNNSWGGNTPSEALRRAVLVTQDMGNLMCAAAGNNASSLEFYPAAYAGEPEIKNVVSVASVDENGVFSSFSNYGDWVDLAAPGERILSTTRNNTYKKMTGTSQATPHAAFTAALIWEKFPHFDYLQVKQRLFDSVTINPALGDRVRTHGIVNAYQALVQR